MKNKLIALLQMPVMAICFCSCGVVTLNEIEGGKEEDEASGFNVRFRVSDISIGEFDARKEAASASRAVVDAKELGNVMNFAVYKEGVKVDAVNQSADEEGFGLVSSKLAEGSYKVVFVVHSGKGNATMSKPEEISFPNNKMTDTFSACVDLEVKKDTTVDVTLSRRVAMYKVTLEEAIPEDVATMMFYYTGGSSTLDATTGFGCKNSRQTEVREVTAREAGQTFSVYTLPHEPKDTLKMTITALDSEGGTLKERTFEGIPIELNKVTTHSCSFFDSQTTEYGNCEFLVKGDNEWDGNIEY